MYWAATEYHFHVVRVTKSLSKTQDVQLVGTWVYPGGSQSETYCGDLHNRSRIYTVSLLTG